VQQQQQQQSYTRYIPIIKHRHDLFVDFFAFSVWGVVLGILTTVLLLWEAIVYNINTLDPIELYLWYSLKFLGIFLAILATCVELELQWLFEGEVGGVPVHCDFLRNWVRKQQGRRSEEEMWGKSEQVKWGKGEDYKKRVGG
jgi:hypothetical protein